MEHELSWHTEKRVIKFKLDGNLTIDDIKQASQTIIQMFNTCDAPLVHLLIDETNVGRVPPHLKELVNASACLLHPQMGWLITYGKDSQLLKFLSYMVAQVTQIRHRRLSNQAEALDFLQTVDMTLPRVHETEEV